MSDYDPSNLGEQEDLKAQREVDDRNAAAEAIDDFKWLMNGPRGRRIVWRLLSDAGMFQSTFKGDALQSAFAEGQRNAGLRLMGLIHEHGMDQYLLMLKERKNVGSDRAN